MVGFRHGPGISFRRTWLPLAPTSLGEDVTPRMGDLTRTWPEFNPEVLTWTWLVLDPEVLTRTWPGRFHANLALTWPELDPHFTHVQPTWTRPNPTERTGLNQSRDTATSPLLLITDRPTYRPTHPKPRPSGYRHGRGPEDRARTQIPLGAPCPKTTPTRPLYAAETMTFYVFFYYTSLIFCY